MKKVYIINFEGQLFVFEDLKKATTFSKKLEKIVANDEYLADIAYNEDLKPIEYNIIDNPKDAINEFYGGCINE